MTTRVSPPSPGRDTALEVVNTRQPKVLIVEDEALIALDIERRVRRLGYAHAGTADNRDDAVALFKETNPDLVLMDISILGPVDGIDTARELSTLGDAPVIFITAFADDATVARAAEVSPFGYLQKPFDDRTLAVTVKVALARHSSSRANRVLSHIVSFASIGVLVVAVDGDERPIVYANEAFSRLSGQPLKRIIGRRPCFLAADPESDPAVRLMDAVKRLAVASETVRGRGPDGTTFWTSVSVSPVVDPSGAVRHLVLLHLDVTEERTAQDALAEVQRVELLGQFAASISHDFNNVVAVIQSFAHLARDAVSDQEVRRDIDGILAATQSGRRLTRRLLEFAKGADSNSKSRSDLTRVLRDAERLLRASAGEGVTLEMRLTPHPMWIAMDASAVEQVMLNLVVNARDAMPQGGRVTIATQNPADSQGAFRAGRYARIVVADQGPGMPAEVAAKAFSPFFSTKPRGKGTGLGLSTCLMLVQRAGGTIELDSAPGRGTTFTILLPLHELAGESTPSPDDTAGDDSEVVVEDTCCLLVEADAPLRQAYAMALENRGFHVVEAVDEAEALDALARLPCSRGVLVVGLADGDDAPHELLAKSRAVAPELRHLVLCGLGHELRGLDPATKLLWHPVASKTLLGYAIDAVTDVGPAPSRPAGARAPSVSDDVPSRNRLMRPTLDEAARKARAEAPAVLIAEDEDAIRRQWAQALGAAGMRPIQAPTAADAIACVAREPIDVCITDLNLPGMTGFDVLTTVKAHDPLTPVIIVTGTPTVEKAQEALRRQASGFLVKPIAVAELASEVRRVFQDAEVARMQRSFLLARHGSDAIIGDPIGTGARLDASLKSLFMHFQPIVQAYDGQVFGYEALMRSAGPMKNPQEILVACEALGRIEELSARVRSLVANVLRERPERSEPVFVNLHPLELDSGDIGGRLDPLLPFADRVVLEVTERAKFSSNLDITKRVASLRDAGYRIALDDLGEGYAGLSWLVKLLPDIAKLDMSLVRDIGESRLRRELVGSIVGTCRRAGTLVVAEGVETAAEARILGDLGCDLLQGYHFGRPGPPFPEVPGNTDAAVPNLTRTRDMTSGDGSHDVRS